MSDGSSLRTSCANCGRELGEVAFCVFCGTPVAPRPAASCGTCGAGVEPESRFCTGCGCPIDEVPPPHIEALSHSSVDRSRFRIKLLAGLVVAVLLSSAVAWSVATWLVGRDADLRAGDADRVETTTTEVERGRGDDEATDEASPTTAGAETGTTPPPSTGTSTVEPASTATSSVFAARDEVYGRYVAVLWSGFVSSPTPPDGDDVVRDQLATLQGRFGSNVIAIDSNQFRSLRDGTVAVVFDGGFSNAREAKLWCRNNGFPGIHDCFGVVLSDDYTPDQRGHLIRIYDL